MVKVTIDQGTLVGNKCATDNGFEYLEFLQIPFAKPPVGQLRFKEPQPPDKWEGELNVTRYDERYISYQFNRFKNCFEGSENCLYLNIYTPNLPTHDSKHYPVMVYFHGGAFMVGNGICKESNGPDFLIEEDVVVITINYRLGAFGFLCLSIPEAAGNMGLKDQLMALKWIQNNISKFGGNKDNVTIFGISAGSASIEHLFLSPQGKGLFHKAIMQSGSTLNHWAVSYHIQDISTKLAQELGYKGLTNNNREIYEFLLKQPIEAIGASSLKLSNQLTGTDFGFSPCIEKDFGDGKAVLTGNVYDLLEEGRFNKVPVLRGFCEFEGLVVMALKPKNIKKLAEDKNFTEYWTYPLTVDEKNEYNKKFAKVYIENRRSTDDDEQCAINFFGDFDSSSGMLQASKFMASQEIPVYFYIFAYDGGINMVKKSMFNIKRRGACHADDTGYIINIKTMDLKPSETDLIVRKRLVKMWTNFAKTGNPTPNTNDLIPVMWPRFTTNQQQYLRIDTELTVESKYQPERIAVFEEIYKKHRK